MSKAAKTQETQETQEQVLRANLDPSLTFSHPLELQYYHVVLINPRTDEFGQKVEPDRLVSFPPDDYRIAAERNFYGYHAKVLHDPTIKPETSV